MIVDELVAPRSETNSHTEYCTRLNNTVERGLEAANGFLTVALGNGEELILTTHNACSHCSAVFFKLSPSLFSFNSPDGMCPNCNGLGVKLTVDPDLIISNPDLSLLDGASSWHGSLRQKVLSGNWMLGEVFALAEHYGVDLERTWKKLPKKFRDAILYGTGEEKLRFHYRSDKRGRSGEIIRPAQGAINNINRLFHQTKSENNRQIFLQFMREQPCPGCRGERLCPEARFVAVGDTRFPEVATMTIAQAQKWITELPKKLDKEQLEIAGEIITALRCRLGNMLNVGLHYLSLDRPAPTLSGGEGQRIRLATQLGCGLTGLLYILDEPSIGLHPRDHSSLLDTICKLRDEGNTILVVEHDADTMRAADYLLDLGPGAGVLGGKLIAFGTPEAVMANPDSLTGRYLNGQLQVTSPNGKKRRKNQGWLTLYGAHLHNLKGIDARFPLGVKTCVTGVSGSGKSSLITQTLSPALFRDLHGIQKGCVSYDRIEGVDQIDKVVSVNQVPIGRTPRSNPATYVEVFDEIRKVFAKIPEGSTRGYKVNRFSFNSKGGRCEVCEGLGKKRVEMYFLPDVWITCKECNGRRFNRQTLEIKYKGRSIADVLDMDVQEALEVFGELGYWETHTVAMAAGETIYLVVYAFWGGGTYRIIGTTQSFP